MGGKRGTPIFSKRRIAAAILAACCAALAVPATTALSKGKVSCAKAKHPGGDWPTYGHDLSNTRNQPDEKKIGPLEAATLQPAWTFSSEAADGEGDFSGTPIVVDGCVYVGSNDGWVFAINADDGKLVWSSKVKGGGINASVGVDGGRVFATVSNPGKPFTVALDQDTGQLLWKTTVDTQDGADLYSSPVVYKGLVFVGWSGGSAELGDESDRYRFQGGFVLLDARSGRVVKKTYTIRPPDKNVEKPKNDFAGGAMWATPAIDTKTGYAYIGTGNPFRPQQEHKHTNAIVKIDLDRSRPKFGEIVDHYHGVPDEYVEAMKNTPCFDIPGNPAPYYPQGAGSCSDLDLDFGASPNLWRHKGKTFVGEGQKAGIYHAVNADNMKKAWTSIVGPPGALGGIVGSTAISDGRVYGPITIPGYLWAVDRSSGLNSWFSPTADGAHWGNPVSTANGVVYTVDLKGFLHAFDAATGAPVQAYPLWLAGEDGLKNTWGGVSIARNKVYAAVGTLGLPGGFIHAFEAR